jgi:hypothetical protein
MRPFTQIILSKEQKKQLENKHQTNDTIPFCTKNQRHSVSIRRKKQQTNSQKSWLIRRCNISLAKPMTSLAFIFIRPVIGKMMNCSFLSICFFQVSVSHFLLLGF